MRFLILSLARLGLAAERDVLSIFLAAVILSGVLAAADPGVLEAVEARRVRNGWGLTEAAGPGVLLIATES